MIQETVIAAFLLVVLAGAVEPGASADSALVRAAWTLGPMALIGVWCVWRVGLWGRQLDRGRLSAVDAAERTVVLARLLALSWHAWSLFAWGWADAVRAMVGDLVLADELLASSPPIVIVMVSIASFYAVERRLREAVVRRALLEGWPVPPLLSRWRYVWFWFRHAVAPVILPVCLLAAWAESVDRFWPTGGEGSSGETPGGTAKDWWAIAVQGAGVALIVALGPWALTRVWPTIPLGAGELRDRLRAVCGRNAVRVANILLWRTGGTIHNAAVLGVLPRFRYILVTDGLIERMPAPLLEAIAAHEVGHVRHRHLAWLAASTIAGAMTLASALGWGAWGVLSWSAPRWHGSQEEFDALVEGVRLGVGLATLMGAILWFGFVSRRMEWQADAFAAADLTRSEDPTALRVAPEAAGRVIHALGEVAMLAGIHPDRFMWRHGSIRTRQRKLGELMGCDLAGMPPDRVVRKLKLGTIVLLALGAAAMFWLPGLG
jgi:STE24 endopeptidase